MFPLAYLTGASVTYLYLSTHPWYWHLSFARRAFWSLGWPIALVLLLVDEDLQ